MGQLQQKLLGPCPYGPCTLTVYEDNSTEYLFRSTNVQMYKNKTKQNKTQTVTTTYQVKSPKQDVRILCELGPAMATQQQCWREVSSHSSAGPKICEVCN